jgi:DNA-binding HxlR family transcriptional regulator
METTLEPFVYQSGCPTRSILDRIADKWTTLVISILSRGTARFSQLHRSIEGISHKMLAQTLRELERDGLVTRTVYPEVPPRVEYELTPLGHTLIEPIRALTDWAEAHFNEVRAARERYDGNST